MLPILAFPTKIEAAVYLATFGLGTVISMATFSSVIGWVSSRCSIGGARVYRGMMSGCSVAAMAVGGFWLFTSFR